MGSRFKEICKKYFPYIALIAIGVLFTLPLFSNIYNTGARDWDYFCFSNEVARDTILNQGQVPLWNPYAAGGIPLHANPQSAFLRPAFLFSLIFGCVIGLKIEVLVTLIFGMIGMFLLSQYYTLHSAAGIIAASVFGLSSFFSLHITEGHLTFLSFYLVPYIFLFYLKSFEQKRYIFFAGIFIMLIIFAGGAFNVLPQVSIFLFTYGIFSSIQKRNIKPILNLIGIFLIAFCLGAIKTLPTMEYLMQNPRPIQSNEFTPFFGLYDAFLNRHQILGAHHMEPQSWGWHEYGAYTGMLPLILFALGLIFFFKREYPLVLSGLFAFLISLGDYGSFSPWHLLHRLPLLDSLHVPSRYIMMFIFSLAMLAGLSFNMFINKTGGKKSKYFLFAIMLFIAADLIFVNGRAFTQAFPNSPQQITAESDFKQMHGTVAATTARSAMYLNLLANRGTLDAYEPVPHQTFAKGFTDADYTGEVYMGGNGTASYSYWSPNKLIVGVDARNSDRLVINQNYDKGWRVKGKIAENFNGLLSTTVTPSDKIVEFYYLPTSFIIGLIVTLVSIISVVTFSFKYLKKENHR